MGINKGNKKGASAPFLWALIGPLSYIVVLTIFGAFVPMCDLGVTLSEIWVAGCLVDLMYYD